ncbi:MAG: Ig-like domain-containing protein [Bacteroidales bacterium]|nr:Ig-like domain-containing protein [Bacteroidales bacterium]
MKRTVVVLLLLRITMAQYGQIIIDHNSTLLGDIPATYINQAKSTLHIAYEHTSHGSQITDGMTGLFNWKGSTYAWNNGGMNGALDIHDNGITGGTDLGSPDFTSWAAATRTYLGNSANSNVNVVMWAWCGQLSTATENDVNTYLALMSSLETDFPRVKFVYMTGHLDGTGISGNLHRRNEQIRNYCRTNSKILYDFADIESYDPDNNYYLNRSANDNCDYDSNNDGSLDRNWAIIWQNSHTLNVDWYNCTSAHSQPLNANRKAYAAWWLWARLAGWNGSPPAIPVSSISVSGAGGSTVISVNKGTLELSAQVLPSNASNKSVIWSIAGGTGQATISQSGLVTAITDGKVTAVASSTDGSAVSGIIEITIINQMIPVSGIMIVAEEGTTVISAAKGTLQLTTEILPEHATDKSVDWSVENVTGKAVVNESGLVTGIEDGVVKIVASAKDGSGVSSSLEIKINKNKPLIAVVNDGLLRVPLEGDYTGHRLSLIDIRGRLIKELSVEGNLCEFNVSSLSSGIYIVALSRAGIVNVTKILIP